MPACACLARLAYTAHNSIVQYYMAMASKQPSVVALQIKWGKESIDMPSFNPSMGTKGLKAELEEKTGVPADRMKIMAKSKGLWKGVLKDDFDLTSLDLTAALSKAKGGPLLLLLMGSATKLAGPSVKTVFLEDLPEDEIAKVAEPSGLVNLGNTCYLNSVVQCLRAIDPLRKGLRSYQPGDPATSANPVATQQNQLLLQALKETLERLDKTSSAMPPSGLVRITKLAFPQFAQLSPQQQPMQQDAEEFYSGILSKASSETRSALGDFAQNELLGASNLIDAVFGMKMEERLTCDEFDNTEEKEGDTDMKEATADTATTTTTTDAAPTIAEPAVVTTDLHRKLVCNIQGGQGSTVNISHIAEGISLGLEGKIEKHSDVLGRNAIWTRSQRIARLPQIIVVQFGRFYWKATPESQDHAGVKCKIMKKVAFSSVLDVYDFCTTGVQKVLKASRDKALKKEEERINKKLEGKEEQDAEMQDASNEEEAALQAALALSMESHEPPVGPGLPLDFEGQYELFAAVTHKGRSADGGHYMGWVKSASQASDNQKIGDTDEANEDWYVFDDDEVSPCKTEDILKLQGGGDYDMSYLNFYRAKK